MAGKGGGAWKVAYADFVTAMMAFFLVMWLCAQNQEVKRSVADYFSDPLGSLDATDQKRTKRSGSTTEFLQSGTVPAQQKVALGKGRRSHSPSREFSPTTKMVADWVHVDPASNEYWQKQAQAQREDARFAKDVQQKRKGEKQLAIEKLAAQMQEEFQRSLPAQTDGLFRQLAADALKDVNWREIAEDLIDP